MGRHLDRLTQPHVRARATEGAAGCNPVPGSVQPSYRHASGCPVITGVAFARMRGFAVSLTGLGLGADGVVRCDQPRVLDLRARNGRPTRDRVPNAVMDDMLGHAAVSIMPRNTIMAQAGHGANPPRVHLHHKNSVPRP